MLVMPLKTLCHADEIGVVTGLHLNRYVSFKADEVKLRVGPGKKYQTSHVYQCKNYPVKIIEEFDHWRKVEDVEGTQGWVHQSLLSGVNYAIVKNGKYVSKQQTDHKLANNQVLIFRSPNEEHNPIAKIEFDTIVKIVKCENDWCKVNANSTVGWMKEINLWGGG